jgi:3-oxoacyl-ACP reductase-like protein
MKRMGVALVLVVACSRKEAPPAPAAAPAPLPSSSAAPSACASDRDCVPAECCHAKTCSTVKPRCDGIVCSMSIEPGTLDVGRCVCRAGACVAEIRAVDASDMPQ